MKGRASLPLALVLTVLWISAVLAAPAGDAKHLTVKFVNAQLSVTSTGSTVGQVLTQAGILLPKDSLIVPPTNSAIADGETISLPRIEMLVFRQSVRIPPKVLYRVSPRLAKHGPVIAREGIDGLGITTTKAYRKDGIEVHRTSSTKVLRAPLARIVVVAKSVDALSASEMAALKAKLAGRSLKPPTRYTKKVVFEATAFAPNTWDGHSFIDDATASGMKAEYGVVAVDPKVIALGTRLFIEGYGYAIAGDTGGAIRGRRIDLCFGTYEECVKFGRRKVTVYILP
jgi:3D (Asp-Asp-Asp) domain-containing protein